MPNRDELMYCEGVYMHCQRGLISEWSVFSSGKLWQTLCIRNGFDEKFEKWTKKTVFSFINGQVLQKHHKDVFRISLPNT